MAQQVANDVTQTQLQLQASGLANYSPYNRVARDLVTVGATLQGVVELIDRQAPPATILGEVQQVQIRVDRIHSVLANDPNLPPSLGQCWELVRRDLSALGSILSSGAGPFPGPGPLPGPGPFPGPYPPPYLPPTIIQPPTVTPPLPPAYGGPLALLDEWLAALDRLIAIQQTTVASVPQGFQLLGDARQLRSSVSRLRQQIGAGVPPPGFLGAYREAERDYGRLRQRVDAIARGRSGPNIDLVRSMQSVLEQFRAYAYQ
jgi:hypothetical protein